MRRVGLFQATVSGLFGMVCSQALACAGAPPRAQPTAAATEATAPSAALSAAPAGTATATVGEPATPAPAPAVQAPLKRDAIGAITDQPDFLSDVQGYVIDEACPDVMLRNSKVASSTISVAGMNGQQQVEIRGTAEASFGELFDWVAATKPPGRRVLFGFVEFPPGTPYGWRGVCVLEEAAVLAGELTRVESLRDKGLVVAVAQKAVDRLKAKGTLSGRLAFGKAGFQLVTPTRLPLDASQGIILYAK